MSTKIVVFTPLRIALIAAIVIFNLMAIAAYIFSDQTWAYYFGIFSVVFIMLLVFVILLEWTWLHHMEKAQTDLQAKAQYKKAKLIYTVLFLVGFVISYLVLI